MPTSSEAVTGEYTSVYVPEQNYNRLEREDSPSSVKEVQQDPVEIPSIPSIPVEAGTSNTLKIVLIVGLIATCIIAAGVLPAVILSQVVTTSTNTSAFTASLSSSATTTVSSSSSSSSTSASTAASTISSSCGPFSCNYVVGSSETSPPYWGTEQVNITCTHPLSNFTGRIYVQTTAGASYGNQYNTFWGGVLSQSNSTSGSQIIYAWDINAGQTVVLAAFPLFIEAQFQLNGINQIVASDTYTIIAESACTSQVLTQNGHF